MKKSNKVETSELKTLAEIVYNSYKNNLPKYKFYLMDHRGGLKEALETIKQITEQQYKELNRNYSFYGYDDRIGCLRYIVNDLEHSTSPAWLLISDLGLKEIKEKRI